MFDPSTGGPGGAIENLSEEEGTLWLRRGPTLEDAPMPDALIPGGPYNTKTQQAALRRLARSVLGGEPSFAASKSILVREPFPAPLPQDDLGAAKEIVAGLDGGHLVIQGPPGTGKTYTRRAPDHAPACGTGGEVGVTAQSHKVIHNLLDAVERGRGARRGCEFRGVKYGDDVRGRRMRELGTTGRLRDPSPRSSWSAGTAWLWAREGMAGSVDVLFVDEAGQVRSPTRSPSRRGAKSVVLLGDPQQLAHVSQGTHPARASGAQPWSTCSATTRPSRPTAACSWQTWRMHPAVCEFISETMYDGRLGSVDGCAPARGVTGPHRQRPRLLTSDHEDNRGWSPRRRS